MTEESQALADPVQEGRRIIARAEEKDRGQIEQAPKGIRWRARAKVGDRARWYELPEEVDE